MSQRDRSAVCAEVEASGLRHIAFIMDGNGRWAQKRGMPRSYGHVAGARSFRRAVEYCCGIGIDTVTVYAFSTENWKRPEEEIEGIMKLLRRYLGEAEKTWRERDLHVRFLGDRTVFPPDLRQRLEELEAESAGRKRTLNVAFNYGGRADIVRAVNALIVEGRTGITEQDITSHLDTAASPPPDLIVRTGAEQRLSNFMLWEAAYAELYFTDVLWPDFDRKQIDACVAEFSRRRRRFGGL